MQAGGHYIEIRTSDGKPIFSFYLLWRELTVEEKQKHQKAAPSFEVSVGSGNGQNGSHNKNGEQKRHQPPIPASNNGQPVLMTESQKRYLFRILAERGIEEDQALEYLKKLFNVQALKDVTKQEASRGIEQLLAEAKGVQPQKGGEHHAH